MKGNNKKFGPSCQAEENGNVKCTCGATMEKTIVSNIYENHINVHCNKCCKALLSTSIIYQCEAGQTESHPNGYDICAACAENSVRSNNFSFYDCVFCFVLNVKFSGFKWSNSKFHWWVLHKFNTRVIGFWTVIAYLKLQPVWFFGIVLEWKYFRVTEAFHTTYEDSWQNVFKTT